MRLINVRDGRQLGIVILPAIGGPSKFTLMLPKDIFEVDNDPEVVPSWTVVLPRESDPTAVGGWQPRLGPTPPSEEDPDRANVADTSTGTFRDGNRAEAGHNGDAGRHSPRLYRRRHFRRSHRRTENFPEVGQVSGGQLRGHQVFLPMMPNYSSAPTGATMGPPPAYVSPPPAPVLEPPPPPPPPSPKATPSATAMERPATHLAPPASVTSTLPAPSSYPLSGMNNPAAHIAAAAAAMTAPITPSNTNAQIVAGSGAATEKTAASVKSSATKDRSVAPQHQHKQSSHASSHDHHLAPEKAEPVLSVEDVAETAERARSREGATPTSPHPPSRPATHTAVSPDTNPDLNRSTAAIATVASSSKPHSHGDTESAAAEDHNVTDEPSPQPAAMALQEAIRELHEAPPATDLEMFRAIMTSPFWPMRMIVVRPGGHHKLLSIVTKQGMSSIMRSVLYQHPRLHGQKMKKEVLLASALHQERTYASLVLHPSLCGTSRGAVAILTLMVSHMMRLFERRHGEQEVPIQPAMTSAI